MSKKIIDCVFYHDNKTSLQNRITKYSEIVDKFIIFYKNELDMSIFTGVTKPVELILVEEELYIDELIKNVKEQELDFEDIISISVTNEFYQTEILEDVVKLLPFGPVLLNKYIYYTNVDPIEYDVFKGTLFMFHNQIKNDVFDTKKIWLGKQNPDTKVVNLLDGGYQD